MKIWRYTEPFLDSRVKWTTCFLLKQLYQNCTDSTQKNASIFSYPELTESVAYKLKPHIIELSSNIPQVQPTVLRNGSPHFYFPPFWKKQGSKSDINIYLKYIKMYFKVFFIPQHTTRGFKTASSICITISFQKRTHFHSTWDTEIGDDTLFKLDDLMQCRCWIKTKQDSLSRTHKSFYILRSP